MAGSCPNRANKFLYAPAPPPPSVWALKPPSWALVHKTTYAPMIYTAQCIMFWMSAYLKFFGPLMALANQLDAISLGPKICPIPGPNPPRNQYACIQNIMHGAV